jgi:hypothetical protein
MIVIKVMAQRHACVFLNDPEGTGVKKERAAQIEESSRMDFLNKRGLLGSSARNSEANLMKLFNSVLE